MGDETLDPELRRYYEELDALAEQARQGEIDKETFRRNARRVALAAILALFLLGGGEEDVEGAAAVLAEQERVAREAVDKLSEDIYNGDFSERDETADTPGQTDETGRGKLDTRLALWTGTAAAIYALGQVHKPPTENAAGELEEPRYTWRLGNTIQHCTDCATLNGQTHTADEWRRAGISPQSPDLECGGWNCDCRLEQTEAASIGFTF